MFTLEKIMDEMNEIEKNIDELDSKIVELSKAVEKQEEILQVLRDRIQGI